MSRQYRPLVLREFHASPCACSICRRFENAGHRSFGLIAPQDKTWNAWRRLFYVSKTGICYWRWTGFWQKQPQWKAKRGAPTR